MRFYLCVVAILAFCIRVPGQTQLRTAPPGQSDFTLNVPSTTPTSLSGKEYRIGRDDLLEISVFEVPELAATTRVTASGTISLPLLGSIVVTGRTPLEIERIVEEALRKDLVNDPHVTVFVREYASQPVSVIGAVRTPGIYQIKGQKFLLDMLAMAQGLDASAGKVIQVIRANARDNAESESARETITIDAEDLFERGKTDLNISISAGDVINVLRAGSIFVVGEVIHPNEFVLRNGRDITVTQAIALANGFTKDAKRNECIIIRYYADGRKEELPADAAKILRGDSNDVAMQANDILFVPANKVKSGLMRALDSTIAIVSGRLVYGF